MSQTANFVPQSVWLSFQCSNYGGAQGGPAPLDAMTKWG